MDESSERLQLARRRAGYDGATSAARAFGWNVNTYRSHENSTRGLRTAAATRYAKAFHVSPAWLLTGEEAGQSEKSDTNRLISVDPEDLRKIIALVLRSQRTENQLAIDLADTVVSSLLMPPLDAVDRDPVRSVAVRLELQALQLATSMP